MSSPAIFRAAILATITTDASGRKTWDEAKCFNALRNEYLTMIGSVPAQNQAYLIATLDDRVRGVMLPLRNFFSDSNLRSLGLKAVDVAAALLSAANDVKVRADRLRDFSTTRTKEASRVARDIYAAAPAGRAAEEAVSRITDTRFYICTYVNDWGDESAHSPISVMTGPDQNDQVTLTCPVPPAGANIQAIRIYRSNAGSQSASFQYVTTLDVGTERYYATYPDVLALYQADSKGMTQHAFAEDHYRRLGYIEKRVSPAEQALSWPIAPDYWSTQGHNQYVDKVPASALQEACPTLTWVAPPANLRGLTNMPNGVLAGFFDSTICFCEPYTPYAWPVEYQITTDSPIVGMAVFGQTLVVLTEGFPYYVSGADSASMSAQKLEAQQACVSPASIVAVDGGVVFASPDGLCLASGSGVQNLTGRHFARADWQALSPTTLRCAYHDGVVYFLSSAMASTYALSLATGKLGTVTGTPSAFFSDLKTDRLYAVQGSTIKALFSGTTLRTGLWRSKVVVLPAQAGFSWLVAESDFAAPITVRWYGDGVLRHTAVLTNRTPVRLPAGRYLEHEIEVESATRWNSLTLAGSTAELQGVPS